MSIPIVAGQFEAPSPRRANNFTPRGDRWQLAPVWPILIGSLIAHGLFLYWAMRAAPAPVTPPTEVQTISVSMVASENPQPAQAAPAPPTPVPPKQKSEPVTRQPSTQPTQAPSAPSASAASAPSSPAAAPSPQSAPGPSVSDPRFDADYLKNPSPVYPNLSRRLRETGTVQLRVLVSKQGQPMNVTVLESGGYARLDEAALAAVRRWKFQPAMRGDVPVEANVIVPVEFSLEGFKK